MIAQIEARLLFHPLSIAGDRGRTEFENDSSFLLLLTLFCLSSLSKKRKKTFITEKKKNQGKKDITHLEESARKHFLLRVGEAFEMPGTVATYFPPLGPGSFHLDDRERQKSRMRDDF